MMNDVSVVHLYFRKCKWLYRCSALSSIGPLKDQLFFYVLVELSRIIWCSKY
jgi:hypothetical protein